MIEKRGTIGADHPALPGHFPGDPIVPGVVLLNEVLSALPGRMDIAWAKFHGPLRPGEAFAIRFDGHRFSVHRGDKLIASGTLRPA